MCSSDLVGWVVRGVRVRERVCLCVFPIYVVQLFLLYKQLSEDEPVLVRPGGSSSPPSHPDSLHTYCPSLQLHESVCSLLPLGSLLGLHLPPFLLSLSIYLSIHLSIFLSFSLCTSLPLCLSINRSVYAANQYLHHETLVMALNTGVCEYIYDSYTRGKNIE